MTRIKSHNPGEGVTAYMAVYKWYTSTSGQGVPDKMSKAMNPTPPRSDADRANAIERWEENLKQLEAMGEGYNLMTEFRKTALGRLDVWGPGQEHLRADHDNRWDVRGDPQQVQRVRANE